MLVQLKNAQARGHAEAVLPFSAMKFKIAEIMVQKGFIESAEKRKKKGKKTEFNVIGAILKYKEGAGAISGSKMISKPSRKIYAAAKDLKPVMSGYGISVVSTSKGIMTGDDARKVGVGGEIICEIW